MGGGGDDPPVHLEVPVGDLALLGGSFLLVVLLALGLHLFLCTDFGTALRPPGTTGRWPWPRGSAPRTCSW